MNKYDHVRQAKQSRGHTCHWNGCKKQVPPAMWGCTKHWFKLPKRLRDKVWSAYSAGQEEQVSKVSTRYVEVAREVENWIDAQELL